MSPVVYLGNGAIALAIALSLFGILLFYASIRIGSPGAAPWAPAPWARAAHYLNFALMTAASLAMVYALLRDDFSVSYVAHVGSRETPRWISAISLWSSLEGSILLWVWVLAAYSALFVYLNRERETALFHWAGLILLVIQCFFYLLLALAANPFLPIDLPPLNGPGPNPLLQNHWLMAVHPPCLYIGYIGFSVPFALALSVLLSDRSDKSDLSDWTALARPWILFPWSFLSIAIVLGGWWSYAVLGWGGYWAWDPVENASFMPWLSATALLHSMMVQERRRLLPLWNISLAVLTFLLTILGTFLTRSGVLDSVHSFTESHVGPYFLVFISLALAVSLALLLWRGASLKGEGRIENLFSLEVLFLFNNLLFLSFLFVVFLGTLYPLVVEAIRGTRLSVGEPYFNQMTVPLTGMILLLMSVGWITPWGRGEPGRFFRQIRGPLLASLLISALFVLLGIRNPAVVILLFLSVLVFFVILFEALRHGGGSPRWGRRIAGLTAHIGALIVIVAVSLSSAYERDQEMALKKGEGVLFGGYRLTLDRVVAEEVPQRFEVKAVIQVERGGKPAGILSPQMNFYPNSREPIGSPAIRSSLLEDLYLTLIHFEKDGSSVSLRAMVSPVVSWIWVGGGVVMLGGLWSLISGRKKGGEGR